MLHHFRHVLCGSPVRSYRAALWCQGGSPWRKSCGTYYWERQEKYLCFWNCGFASLLLEPRKGLYWTFPQTKCCTFAACSGGRSKLPWSNLFLWFKVYLCKDHFTDSLSFSLSSITPGKTIWGSYGCVSESFISGGRIEKLILQNLGLWMENNKIWSVVVKVCKKMALLPSSLGVGVWICSFHWCSCSSENRLLVMFLLYYHRLSTWGITVLKVYSKLVV